MSFKDVDDALKSAISNNSPENRISLYEKLQRFVSQRPAEVGQFEARLLDLYHSRSSVAPLDTYIEVLYIIRDHLTAESIARTWWHFVLRPALRRTHMPLESMRHAIEIVVGSMKENHPGMRRTLLQLYVLGTPSLTSPEDAVDTVALGQEERAQLSRWKGTLVTILTKDSLSHPLEFFEEMDHEFLTADNRLTLTQFLSDLGSRDDFPVAEFAKSPLLMTILRSLFIDRSATVFTMELTTITKLLPQIAIKALPRLKEILPELFAILARAVCWKPRTTVTGLGPGLLRRDTGSDIVADADVREDLRWQRLESTFDSASSTIPDPSRYLNFLYGIFPCNTLAFLRDPVKYLVEKDCRSPYENPWEETINVGIIRVHSERMVKNLVIHPNVVMMTAQEELEGAPSQLDVSSLAGDCSRLDIHNAVASSQPEFSTGSFQAFNIWQERGASGSISASTVAVASSSSLISASASALAAASSSSNPAAEPKKAIISIRQLIDTHALLRSGLPVDIVNDYGDVSATPRMHTSRTLAFENAAGTISATLDRTGASGATDGSRSPEAVSLSSTQFEEARDEAIAILQRDLLLVMNELNFESYLRRQHLAQIGSLKLKGIQAQRSERERLSMREQIKHNEQEIERHKREKSEMQSQIDRYREGGDNYSVNMRSQLNKMKQEKQAWLNEAQELRTRDAENKDVLEAQRKRLSVTESRIFELENERTENAVKLTTIADYEKLIENLQKAAEVWDIDHRRLKFQDDIIEQLKSKAFNMQAIIDSEKNANARLADHNRYLEEQAERLEIEVESLRQSTTIAQSQDLFRHSREAQKILQSQNDALEEEVSRLRSLNNQLQDQLQEEQAKREALQNRENRERSERLRASTAQPAPEPPSEPNTEPEAESEAAEHATGSEETESTS